MKTQITSKNDILALYFPFCFRFSLGHHSLGCQSAVNRKVAKLELGSRSEGLKGLSPGGLISTPFKGIVGMVSLMPPTKGIEIGDPGAEIYFSVCTPPLPRFLGEQLVLPYLGRGHSQGGTLWKWQRSHSGPLSSGPPKLTPSWTFQKVARVGTWATPPGGSRWTRNFPSCRQ